MNENLSSFFQSIFGMNGTIRRYFKNQLFIVGFLFHTEVFNCEFHILDRCVDRVNRNNIQFVINDTMLVCWYISTAFVYGQFHLECSCCIHVANDKFGIQHFESCKEFTEFTSSQNFYTGYINGGFLRFEFFDNVFEAYLLQIQDDVRNIFYYTGDGRELVIHTFYTDGSDCKSFQ